MDGDAFVFPSSPPRAMTPPSLAELSSPSSPPGQDLQLLLPHNGRTCSVEERAWSAKSSSPSPIFSSDDSRETADVGNYESPRIYKNKRKGAWWESDGAHKAPDSKKRKMPRNIDSGVWMNSDATESSDDPLPHSPPFCSNASEGQRSEAILFCARINAGVEKNSEVYHFNELGLSDDDIKPIGRLAEVIRTPPDTGSDVPTERQYRSMEPALYVNLGRNSLRRLIRPLFNVQFLTSLVLRENRLEALPPHISLLVNLQELDVSINRLNHLPAELLSILRPYGSLERLHTMGNPLLTPMTVARFTHGQPNGHLPTDSNKDVSRLVLFKNHANTILTQLNADLAMSEDKMQYAWRIRFYESWAQIPDSIEHIPGHLEPGFFPHHPTLRVDQICTTLPRYMARTPVSFYDAAGRLLLGSPVQPSSDDDCYNAIVETHRGTFDNPVSTFAPTTLLRSRLPSLATLCLHTALSSVHADALREMMGKDLPVDADAALFQATVNDIGGFGCFRRCHVCGRDYVLARAEWTEFWSVHYAEFYPLRMRVCSWGCVPNEMIRPTSEWQPFV